jgi:cytochrome c553
MRFVIAMARPTRAGFVGGMLAVLALAAAAPCSAADIAKGGKIAAMKCAMCHGLDGQAKLPGAPNLAGQVEQYLTAQLKAFHDGARKNEMMSLVAPTLSDEDMADLAAYYAAIEVKIEKVPGQ